MLPGRILRGGKVGLEIFFRTDRYGGIKVDNASVTLVVALGG